MFMGDDDPELIRDALPFTMKMYESLAAKDSTNPELLLATGKLFALYAQAFVLFPSDTLPDSSVQQKKAAAKRAKKLFLRGRDYVLRGLDVKYPGIQKQIKSGASDSALARVSAADTNYLYWSGVAWMGAIAADRSDLALALTMKKAFALIKKLQSIDEQYGSGSVNEILCTYYSSVPKSLGGDTALARQHLTKSIALSKSSRVSAFVTGAALALKKSKRDEFESMLNNALAVNVNEYPDMKLQNVIYQQKAKWMQSKIDTYFPAITDTLTNPNP